MSDHEYFYIEDSDFKKRLNKMPKVFRQRFDKFFRLGEKFWEVAWYELIACEAAVSIVSACRSQKKIRELENSRSVDVYPKLKVKLNGLSDNQFNFAVFMASLYLYDSKLVRKPLGAMSPLCGSEPYIGR